MSKPISLHNQSHRLVNALLKSLALAVLVAGYGWGTWSGVRAQEPEPKSSPTAAPAPGLTPQEQIGQLQRRVAQLTAELSRLRIELAKLERYRQIDYTRDLMIKEEDRIRGWQTEMTNLGTKETALKKRLDEIEKELLPDRIERAMAGVGSTRPDEERAAVTRKLTNEARNIQAQLEVLRSNRTRIPGLIANAEASISRLKQRLTELSR